MKEKTKSALFIGGLLSYCIIGLVMILGFIDALILIGGTALSLFSITLSAVFLSRYPSKWR